MTSPLTNQRRVFKTCLTQTERLFWSALWTLYDPNSKSMRYYEPDLRILHTVYSHIKPTGIIFSMAFYSKVTVHKAKGQSTQTCGYYSRKGLIWENTVYAEISLNWQKNDTRNWWLLNAKVYQIAHCAVYLLTRVGLV